jgi:hypothetical protein
MPRNESAGDNLVDRVPDNVPDNVLAEARRAFGRPRRELAHLVFDSLVDLGAPADDHRLRFEYPQLRIEVHVSAGPENTRLSGTVVPASASRAAVHLEGGDLALVTSVDDGAFSFEPIGHGLVTLSFEGSDGYTTIWTDWFRI